MIKHKTVLLTEAIDALALKESGVYVDATLGAGGHTDALLDLMDTRHTLVSLDADPEALRVYQEDHQETPSARHVLQRANFKELRSVLEACEVQNVTGVLADLGWRTEQFTQGKRGFSFLHDEPLLMTYGDPADYAFVAADVVNEWAEEDIANVIYAYGEERAARKIAQAIVARRTEMPFESATDLAALVASVVRTPRHRKIHPATKTFQALRIVVNDELSVLETFIDEAFDLLESEGRLAIITFHSLEDRIVKHRFRSLVEAEQAVLANKKPITASQEELEENPRARSAKLRVIVKHGNGKAKQNTVGEERALGG